MTQMEATPAQGNKEKKWVWFFVFLGLQSLLVTGRLLSLPNDPKNSQFFGLSYARLFLLLAILIFGLLFLAIAVLAAKQNSKLQSIIQPRWRSISVFVTLEIISLFVSLLCWGALVGLRSGIDGANNPVYLRLQPLLFWGFCIGWQVAIWLWVQKFGLNWKRLAPYMSALKSSAAALFALLTIGLVLWMTKIGITPDIFHWGYPGVPLLSWQVVIGLVAAFSLAIIFVSYSISGRLLKRIDLYISIGLFLLAAVLWLMQPIPRSYFFPIARPPTFQIYPYSDAGFYDYVSQSILVGEGFLNGKIVTRPIYILFLALLHGLAGQDFHAVINLQTIVLAFFPVILFWLGRSLHSREAGLAAALLAVFRELNMIAATGLTEVSHSKMLMTDSLTGLGIALFCLVIVRWLRKPGNRYLSALLSGAFLGLLVLLRSQALLLLPVFIVIIFIQRKSKFRTSGRETALVILGVALMVVPWIIRNGIRAGDFALDQPSQAAILAQRFSSSLAEADTLQFGTDSNLISAHIRDYTLAHPGEVAGFVSAHFINNELATLSVLPLKFSLDDFQDNFSIETLFWLEGVKGVSGWQWLLLGINIMFVAVGIGSAFKRWGWVGISILLFHFAYSLSSAIGRISGWRFIQPVDWVGYFYFCLGFAEILLWIFAFSDFEIQEIETVPSSLIESGSITKRLLVACAAVLVTGMSIPTAEWVIPRRYSPAEQSIAVQVAETAPITISAVGDVESFMRQPRAVRMVGRVLYPRWYKSDAGEPGSGWAAYKAKNYAHLGFVMVGPAGEQQMILNQENPPTEFTHAADVIVYGCQTPDSIDVRLVIGYNHPGDFSYKSDGKFQLCE